MKLLDRVVEAEGLVDLDPAERRLALRALVADEVPAPRLATAVAELADAIDGYGPLTSLMADEEITDILVNAPDEIWVERAGRMVRSSTAFKNKDELRAFATRWLERGGARADAGSPVADARLPCGARLHVVMPPVAPAGPLVSIRKFARGGLSLDQLVEAGAMSEEVAERLRSLVSDRRTLIISGGTGAGKTTLLNALLALPDPTERIVTIEETPELHPRGHVVSLVTRPPTIEGRARVDAAALVRAALRMRPDRIVVGEVRGNEALDALAALSSGHKGSMLTLHARSATNAVERMMMLALGAGTSASESFIRAQLEQAVDGVIHLERIGTIRTVAEVLLV